MNEKYSHKFPTGIVLMIKQGDITLAETKAIVNAANKRLRHGGGVAGAIARRGGPAIQAESAMWVAEHGPISADKPAFTSGGEMACKYVIHAVGPVWGEGDEDEKLDKAIRGALRMGEELKIGSISFPAISTGIYGFPPERAADIFMDALFTYAESSDNTPISERAMVLYSEEMFTLFARAFTLKTEGKVR